MPRNPRLVSLDLVAARKAVQALELELIEARMAERDCIVNLAKQGRSMDDIASALGISRSAAQGVLWRAGRTISGRSRARVTRTVDLAGMLDAKLSLALRHRAPEQAAGRAQ